MACLSYLNITASGSSTTYTGDFVTAGTTTTTVYTTIQLGFQGFFQGVDYVHEKIKEIFDNRAKIKQYRKSLFTDKIKQSSKVIKKQSYTIMIPAKRNFRGQEAQRK